MYVGVGASIYISHVLHCYASIILPYHYSFNESVDNYIYSNERQVPEATAERILVDAINIIKLSSKPLTTDEMNIGYFFCTN